MNLTIKNTIKFIFIFCAICTTSSCKKDSEVIDFIVNIFHSDYDIVESTYISAFIEVDGEEYQLDFETSTNIGEGETRSIPVTVESDDSTVDVRISTSGLGSPSVNVSNVSSGSTVDWTVGDSSAQITTGGGIDNGDGDGNSGTTSDCTEWDYDNTSCLSGMSDGNGSSLAGIRRRACILSETETTLTVNVIVEPTNGGIDNINFYQGVKIYYLGGEVIELTRDQFNNGGTIERTITANKSDLNPNFIGDNWQRASVILFVTVDCINN